MRKLIRNYIAPLLLGASLGAMFLYMVTHPSTCRYEEVC